MDYFAIKLLFFVLVSRPLVVLLHELGHAIPAILMTGETVTIYIGSYADPKKSLHFRIGLLEVWFKYNPFLLYYGVSSPSAKNVSINKQIIYTLGGPLTSFIVASVACYATFVYDVHDLVKLILLISLGWSILDLYTSLIPRASPITLHDGTLTYNDGYYIKQLLSYRKFGDEYGKAVELVNQQQFVEAAAALTDLLKDGLNDEHIYRLAINCLLHAKDYTQAKTLSDEFMLQGKMNSDDYACAGGAYSKLDQHDKAVEFYDKSLELNPDNKYSLNNKGFTMNLLEKYEEAIPLFDKAIEIEDKDAYPYCNRGLAKIKIGRAEEGLGDINYSLTLDEKNAYGYRNLGVYHLDRGEHTEALGFFTKAKELDSDTHMIDTLIAQALKSKPHATSYTQRTAPRT